MRKWQFTCEKETKIAFLDIESSVSYKQIQQLTIQSMDKLLLKFLSEHVVYVSHKRYLHNFVGFKPWCSCWIDDHSSRQMF